MPKRCFFCDVQQQQDSGRIAESKYFIARYDDFPISPGHCEIISKEHIDSFFELAPEQVLSLYDLVKDVKQIVDERFHPDAYNVGLNNGEAAGRTVPHLHMHLIPRYKGDVENPRGGIRNIIPGKGEFRKQLEEITDKKDYL
jgi:diadenosine tetraphosphate (Ap4A) HIT family hydrolase